MAAKEEALRSLSSQKLPAVAAGGDDDSESEADASAEQPPLRHRRKTREPGMHCTKRGLHWCVYDAFYAAIDQPYFTFSEHRECLARVGMPVRVRFQIIRHARIDNVGKSQSCMVSD